MAFSYNPTNRGSAWTLADSQSTQMNLSALSSSSGLSCGPMSRRSEGHLTTDKDYSNASQKIRSELHGPVGMRKGINEPQYSSTAYNMNAVALQSQFAAQPSPSAFLNNQLSELNHLYPTKATIPGLGSSSVSPTLSTHFALSNPNENDLNSFSRVTPHPQNGSTWATGESVSKLPRPNIGTIDPGQQGLYSNISNVNSFTPTMVPQPPMAPVGAHSNRFQPSENRSIPSTNDKSSFGATPGNAITALSIGLPGSIWSVDSRWGSANTLQAKTAQTTSAPIAIADFGSAKNRNDPFNLSGDKQTSQPFATTTYRPNYGAIGSCHSQPSDRNGTSRYNSGSDSNLIGMMENVRLGAANPIEVSYNGFPRSARMSNIGQPGKLTGHFADQRGTPFLQDPTSSCFVPESKENQRPASLQRPALLPLEDSNSQIEWRGQERTGFDQSQSYAIGSGGSEDQWVCLPWEVVKQGPLVPDEYIYTEHKTKTPKVEAAPTGFNPDDGSELEKIFPESYMDHMAEAAIFAEPVCDPSVDCSCDIPISEEEPTIVPIFRATRASRLWKIEELLGGIVHIARDQHGSRFLQQVLDDNGGRLSQSSNRPATSGSVNSSNDGEGESGCSSRPWTAASYVKVPEAGLESPITEYGSDAGIEPEFQKMASGANPPLFPVQVKSAMEQTLPPMVHIVNEVLPHTLTLSRDVFGNYVIQKLLEHAPPSLRRKLANRLLGHAAMLAVHPYGCRVVQRALDTVSIDQAISLAGELESDVLGCVLDQNGNHVIQKALSVLHADAVSFVGDCLISPSTNLAYVARHPYGCRVLQRLLERAEPQSRQRLISRLFTCYPSELVCDAYGNYVAQHLVQYGSADDRMKMFGLVIPNLPALSRHKFGSNVIERLIQFGGEVVRRRVLSEVLGSSTMSPISTHNGFNYAESIMDVSRDETLFGMLRDPYANYVIQTLLDVYSERDDNHGSGSNNIGSSLTAELVLETASERAERKANGILLRRAVRRALPALRGCVGAKVWQMLERRCA